MGFSPRFFYMTPLNFWLFWLGIASPAINSVFREADLSCLAVSHYPEDILNSEKDRVRSASHLDDSHRAYKRPRYEEFHGAVYGNDSGSPQFHSANAGCIGPLEGLFTQVSAKPGHEDGRQNQFSDVNLMNRRPMAPPTGNEYPGLSWNEKFTELPTYTGGGNVKNSELIDSVISDPLHGPHRCAFESVSELETFLNSVDDIAPEIRLSTAQSAGADVEDLREYTDNRSPNESKHQLGLNEPDKEASRQAIQIKMNHGLDRNEPPHTHGDSTVLLPASYDDASGQSFDTTYHTHTKPINLEGQQTGDSRSESYPGWRFQSLSKEILDHIMQTKSSTAKTGATHADTAPLYADVNLQSFTGGKLKGPTSRSVSSSTLEKYVWPYKETVNEILSSCTSNYRGAAKWFFVDIPVVVISQRGLPAPLIRVYSEKQGGLLCPSQIIILLESLLKWVLFNHEAFLNQISIAPQKRPEFHQELLNWLEVEIFRPTGSLPVLGRLETNVLNYRREDFGTVQIKIIEYLHSLNGGMASCKYSIAIIGIWYRNGYLKDWWQSSAGNDAMFCKFMNQTRQAAVQKKITIQHPSDSSMSFSWEQIGNMKICDFQILPTMSPQRIEASCLSKILEDNSEMTESLLTRTHLIYHRYEVKSGSRFKKLSGLPVVLAELTPKNFESYQLKAIRLLDPLNRTVTPLRIVAKLASLVRKTKIYHSILVHLSGERKVKGMIGKQIDLLNWLEKKLFGFEEGLPVVGTIRKDMKIKKEKTFGDVQAYLIYYLARGSERIDGNKSACAIVGYWCKNKCSEFWNETWASDDDYWKFMVNWIKMHKLCNRIQ